MKAIKELISHISQRIMAMSGTYTPYVIFSDWVKMYAIAISNACEIHRGKVWQARENSYMQTAGKYTREQLVEFAGLGDELVQLYEMSGPYDALGEIYMLSGCGSKSTGQFFTPFHVSELTASFLTGKIKNGEIITVNEPSCGGGGMILAMAKLIDEKGGDSQRQMRILAQDLDWNSIYMTYVQLSLNGLDAVCIQGDTLAAETNISPEKIMETPRRKGALL